VVWLSPSPNLALVTFPAASAKSAGSSATESCLRAGEGGGFAGSAATRVRNN
jgi:hypothetical protein